MDFGSFEVKVFEYNQGKQIWVAGYPEFLTEVDCQTSDAESPRFEEVVGGGLAKEVAREEDPNTHFKWKCKASSSCGPLMKEASSK